MAFIEFKNLHTWFYTDAGIVKAVNGVDFEIRKGETVCVVGESGCGKSVTSLSLMHLVQSPPGKIVDGEILMDGRDLLKLSKSEMEHVNGKDVAMIFQEPMTSLNPVLKVGHQIMESILFHTDATKEEARAKALEMIKLVGIPRAEEIMECYPHELSGGMRQRIMIAMALVCNPKLLIADEPTTALDVTIQAQILDLLGEIQKKMGTSTILVSHDLGVVARTADRVAVMYAGKIVEIGTAEEIYYDPRHPYTWGLMQSLPYFSRGKENLYTIPGMPPSLVNPPKGDAYACRNEYALGIDYEEMPPMFQITDTHYAATWLLDKRAPQIIPPVGGKKVE